MRISDWSSDVCAGDDLDFRAGPYPSSIGRGERDSDRDARQVGDAEQLGIGRDGLAQGCAARDDLPRQGCRHSDRSEEHTSELQSLMRISYAVFCLKKKITTNTTIDRTQK